MKQKNKFESAEKQTIDRSQFGDPRPLYRSVEYVDENGCPATILHDIYECVDVDGDNDGEHALVMKERAGYLDFKKVLKWESSANLRDCSQIAKDRESAKLNRQINLDTPDLTINML